MFGHDIHVLGEVGYEFPGFGEVGAVDRTELVLADDSDDAPERLIFLQQSLGLDAEGVVAVTDDFRD